MPLSGVFLLLTLFHLLLLDFCDSRCNKTFSCKNLGPLEYPLTDHQHPGCGLIRVDCDPPAPLIQFGDDSLSRKYEIVDKISVDKYRVRDTALQRHLGSQSCLAFRNVVAPASSSRISISISFPNLTLFVCEISTDHDERIRDQYFRNYVKYRDCSLVYAYYRDPPDDGGIPAGGALPDRCYLLRLPMIHISAASGNSGLHLFQLLSSEFDVEWRVHNQGKSKKKVILAASIPGAAFLVCLLVCFLIWRRQRTTKESQLLLRNVSSDPSSNTPNIQEYEGLCFGIPIFSYTELMEATKNFNPSEELGDGGFGTVYYGKLRDGREVAVKRLYEHNCKRVEQFMNEIKLLTGLRHPNLVSLYGCTSRRSRELLLVYEYVCNGTVADHLHGERAEEDHLTWAIRMNIAVGTASALNYLHRSDIIHRDVKTNNILLDENFSDKVADFGLSRLFPNDVSHVSTAPQGTPGYVDPEYHQCYQLTNKSDVYSFGVVLVELISSMPAVDISRHRHEINLANLALSKIQRGAFDELIDPHLGYDEDCDVTRMTTCVAELAFRCLQLDKEMRPSMDEVLECLKNIQNGNVNHEQKVIPSPETDDVALLKDNSSKSPIAVTDRWISSGSTTSGSID